MVDPDAPDPYYVQFAAILEARIRAGELAGRLPSERHLAEEYGIAYGTVRRAMDILREAGLIRSVHGRGTFAVKPTAS